MTAPTLDACLGLAAHRAPGAEALRAGETALTYGELARKADSVAGALQQLGVRRGERVAIALPNGSDAVVALYAALRAGAAIVPVNPTMKPDKLRFLLEHSGAIALVTTPDHAAAADGLDGTRVVVDLADLSAAEPAAGSGPIDLDLAAILYTSGSTGRPKGVMLTHRNLVFVTASIAQYLDMRAEDRVLSVLPLSFGYGLTQLLTCVHAGSLLVLEPGFGYPGRVVERLEAEQITGMAVVPTILRVLTSLAGLAERRLEHVRFMTNAGAALQATTAAAFRRCFPAAKLYAMYGQTECVRVCYLPPDQLDARPGSVGVAIPGTEVWIEDEDGVEVAAGEAGELVVRGSHVMQGYWNDPPGSGLRLREGRWPWERVLHTGDLFRRDEDGYLWFVSRTDDVIKSRGEKVAPKEIEDVLDGAPGVAEVAVIGVPDDLLGQAVEAHVSAQPGHELDPRELRRFCAERLEDHLVPKRVIVHAELPKTANGKLDRLTLAGGEPA